jgi:hypothetical protein
MATQRLTTARRNGLAILAEQSARRSNSTTSGPPGSSRHRSVYWQTADWLVSQGLAEFVPGTYDQWLRITESGRHALNGGAG